MKQITSRGKQIFRMVLFGIPVLFSMVGVQARQVPGQMGDCQYTTEVNTVESQYMRVGKRQVLCQ